MVALTMEKSADVGMLLVVANYLSEQLNTKSVSLDSNDVMKLYCIFTVMK